MTEPLAREKVEQACGRLQDLYPHLKNIQLILNIDAALRRRLAETQDENRRHRQSITIMQRVANELITEAQNAKVKL